MNAPEEISLTKYLSTSGVCSRRGAEELITAGRVSVNGVTAERGAMRISPGDKVLFDGRPIAPPAEKLYIMLNKISYHLGRVCHRGNDGRVVWQR